MLNPGLLIAIALLYIGVLFLITYVPDVVLFVPRLFGQ